MTDETSTWKVGDIVQVMQGSNGYRVLVTDPQIGNESSFSGVITELIADGLNHKVGAEYTTFNKPMFTLYKANFDTDKEIDKIIRGLNKLMDRYSGQANQLRNEKKRTKASR